MDNQAFAQLLGNYGEFVGAIAVVITLFYLAMQVRLSREETEANSMLLEDSRKLALANAYQARAEMLSNQQDYYQRQFSRIVRIAGPKWRKMGIEEPRDSFSSEVDKLLSGIE